MWYFWCGICRWQHKWQPVYDRKRGKNSWSTLWSITGKRLWKNVMETKRGSIWKDMLTVERLIQKENWRRWSHTCFRTWPTQCAIMTKLMMPTTWWAWGWWDACRAWWSGPLWLMPFAAIVKRRCMRAWKPLNWNGAGMAIPTVRGL